MPVEVQRHACARGGRGVTLAAALAAPLTLVALLAACHAETPSTPDRMAPPPNPLPDCRSPTNCVRVSQVYALDPDTLFVRTEAALGALGPAELRSRPDIRRLDAVDRVLVFKDDVAAVIEPHEEGAALHLRSSSRVGRSDLGVNRRRVQRLLRHIDAGG